MRSKCVSRRVSLPPCQREGADSTPLETRVAAKSKSIETAKSCDKSTRAANVSHFCVSATSSGQHDTAPFGPGFLPSVGTVGSPPEWWQFSISAISPAWLEVAALVALEDASTLACDSAITGSVQPMTHATTAIHKEMPTAVPALIMYLADCIHLRTIHLPRAGGSS